MKLTLIAIATLLLSPALGAEASLQPPESLEAAVAARRDGACAPYLQSLRSQAEDSNATGARARYLLAHCLETLGRAPEAYAAFLETAGRYLPIASHARYHAARVALAMDRPQDALEALTAIDAGSLPRPLSQRLRVIRADALLRIERAADAARILRSLVHEQGLDDDLMAQAWWLLAGAAERVGDRDDAIHAYGMAWWAVPQNRFAADAVRRLRSLLSGRAPVPPADGRIRRGFRLLRMGQPDEAERELLTGARGRPTPDLAAEAWLQIGLLRGGGRRAVSAFREAARYSHQNTRAQYWLGRSLLAAGRGAEGRGIVRRVVSRFPSSPWAPRALLVLARYVEGSDAESIFQELNQKYPGSASADEARWRRGWSRFRAGRFAEAESIFRDAARRYPAAPKTAANLYWAAKAKAARGLDARADVAQVADRYPLTFYGQRANARLGRVPARPADRPGPTRLPEAEFGPAFAELDALGFDAEGAEVAEAAAERTRDRAILWAAAAMRLEAGQVDDALRSSEVAIGPSLYGGAAADRELWMLAYPRAYWDAVQSAAEAANVDPYLVLSVIREESRFDPRAISIAGAVGLMQLLPGTASGVAGATLSVAQLTQPEINIRLGTQFFGGLLRRFRGDVVLAVAGYNAGPGAAQRFGRMSRKDPDLFFERIPFLETRAYVQRVLQSYGIYRWLYR